VQGNDTYCHVGNIRIRLGAISILNTFFIQASLIFILPL
jgi:hypothetical protein